MKFGYEATIGLEVHAQLLTKSKMFCACRNEYGGLPNAHTCPICLGLPGTLPVINKEAVRMAVAMGLAVNGDINKYSTFYRKHYFYPDLPKGYQITQGPLSLVSGGYVEIEGDLKVRSNPGVIVAKIERIHLEEDAGKSNHSTDNNLSYIDLNRAGVPLLEIVGAPVLKSGKEASVYLKVIHKLLTFLNICNGNLEEGSFRCDANVSVSSLDHIMGTRVEIKNINSFKFVKMAVDYEIDRQISTIVNGGIVVQETRSWDSEKSKTKSQRNKEKAMDYCFFPEPNLSPLVLSEEYIESVSSVIPELPMVKFNRFLTQYKLTNYETEMLLQNTYFADFFEEVAKNCDSKQAVNWMLGEVSRVINSLDINVKDLVLTLNPKYLAELIILVKEGVIGLNIAKEKVFPDMITNGTQPIVIIDRMELRQISDRGQIESLLLKIIDNNKSQLIKYFSGKESIKGFFVGQMMKQSKGKFNPLVVKELLDQILLTSKYKYIKDIVKDS